MSMTYEKMMKNIENQLESFAEGFAEERGIPDVAHLVAQDRIRNDTVYMMYEQFQDIGTEYPEHALENCIEYLDMQIRWDTKSATMFGDEMDEYDRLVIDELHIVRFCAEYDPESEYNREENE